VAGPAESINTRRQGLNERKDGIQTGRGKLQSGEREKAENYGNQNGISGEKKPETVNN